MLFPNEFPAQFAADAVETEGSYANMLAKLLPPGVLWNLEADSVIRDVLFAMGGEFQRVDARGANLIDESDPRTATETISDWESMLSLPDEFVTVISTDLDQRRLAVTQKYVSRGGQDDAFFTALVSSCGYTLASITLFANSVCRVGARVGARVYGAAYAYSMQLNISAPTGAFLSHTVLEGVVRKATESHITVIFNYL